MSFAHFGWICCSAFLLLSVMCGYSDGEPPNELHDLAPPIAAQKAALDSLSESVSAYCTTGEGDHLTDVRSAVAGLAESHTREIELCMAVLAEQMAKKRVPTSDLRAYRDVMEGRRVAMMEISFSLFMSPATGLDEMIRLLPYFKPFEQKEVPPHFRRAVWPDTRREVAIVWLRALAAAQSELAGQRYPEVPSSIAGLPDREVAAAKKLMAQAEATRKRRGQLWPFVSNGLVYLQQLYATRPVDREELTDLARIFQVKLEAIPSVSHEDAPRQDKGTADPNQKTPPRP